MIDTSDPRFYMPTFSPEMCKTVQDLYTEAQVLSFLSRNLPPTQRVQQDYLIWHSFIAHVFMIMCK